MTDNKMREYAIEGVNINNKIIVRRIENKLGYNLHTIIYNRIAQSMRGQSEQYNNDN